MGSMGTVNGEGRKGEMKVDVMESWVVQKGRKGEIENEDEYEPAGSPILLNNPPVPVFSSSFLSTFDDVGICSCCSSFLSGMIALSSLFPFYFPLLLETLFQWS